MVPSRDMPVGGLGATLVTSFSDRLRGLLRQRRQPQAHRHPPRPRSSLTGLEARPALPLEARRGTLQG